MYFQSAIYSNYTLKMFATGNWLRKSAGLLTANLAIIYPFDCFCLSVIPRGPLLRSFIMGSVLAWIGLEAATTPLGRSYFISFSISISSLRSSTHTSDTASPSTPACAANAMSKIPCHTGQIEVDNMRQLDDVDSTCSNIRCHQHL